MEIDQSEWWTAFSNGALTAQSCSSCNRRQFPTGHICRSCYQLDSLSLVPISDMFGVCATTVVTTSAMATFNRVVPFVLSTFEATDGIRITLPVCSIEPGSEEGDAVSGPSDTAVALRTLSTNDVVQITPCVCEHLAIPHVRCLEEG